MATSALKEVFANFRVSFDTQQLDRGIEKTEKSEKAAMGAAEAFKRFAAVVGIATVGRALHSFTIGLVDTLDKVDKTSKQLGMSTDAFQELTFAADISGVSMQRLEMSLGILQQRALDASRGLKEAQVNFKELGVSVEGADGELRSTDAILADLANGFARMENPTQKTGVAMKLFGETGKALVPFLEQGSAGIAALRAEARALGVVFDEELIAKGAQTRDALTRLSGSFNALKGDLAVALLPAVESLADILRTSIIPFFQRLTKDSDLVQTALVALTAVGVAGLVAALAPLLSVTGLVVAGFTVLVGVVDSLITSYRGGTSAVREFFQEWFNVDINDILDPMVKGFMRLPTQIGSAIDSLLTDLKRMWLEAKGVANEVASFFGVDLGGPSLGEARREAQNLDRQRNQRARDVGNMQAERENRERGALLLERTLRQTASGATPAQLSASDQSRLEQAATSRLGSVQNFELAQKVARETKQVTLSPTITVNGAQDPKATAAEVRKALERQLREATAAAE